MGRALTISIIIIIIVAAILGLYFLMPSENLEENESSTNTENTILSQVKENALCYDTLEEVTIALESSCSDESLREIMETISKKIESVPEEKRTECSETLGNYLAIAEDSCGNTVVDRLQDIVLNQVKKELDSATDCLDKQAMGLPCD